MKLERAKEIIGRFSGHKILVVGDILLDQYVYGKVERLNPEAPVPILRATKEKEESGGAGNVAKNIASLGAKATLVSTVGDDEYADRLVAAGKREGYESVLVRDKNKPTVRKIRHIVGNQHMLRVDWEDVSDISRKIEVELNKIIEKKGKDVDGIIVSDYAKGAVTMRVAETVLNVAGQEDVLIAADVKPSRAPFFLGATYVSPNIKEAHEFIGVNYHEHQMAPADLAKAVYTKMCSDVFLTLGKDGMYVFCGGEQGQHVPQKHVVEVADESGAGDMAMVVLMLSLLSGASEVEAAELANAGGAAVVSKLGAVGITKAELLGMLEK